MEKMDYPDEIDDEIIAFLRTNPRVTNKDIAARLEIAESTVAQRIRSMADKGIMKVIAQKHVFSDGYTTMCFLFISSSQRPVQEVCKDIAEIQDVFSVAQVLGDPDIFVGIRSKSILEAHDIRHRIGGINGVDSTDMLYAFRVHKYVASLGTVSATHAESAEADDSIFAPLSADGRQSNREVGRQLGISASTVRQRLAKMLRGGEIKFEVVCNPASLRLETAAIIRITSYSRHTEDILERLGELEAIGFLIEVTGKANILALATATNAQDLANLCDEQIFSIPGVRSIQVQLLISTTKDQVHYAYFDGLKNIPKRKGRQE
jgi:DNA-binding Lrp family transcriptional regulator